MLNLKNIALIGLTALVLISLLGIVAWRVLENREEVSLLVRQLKEQEEISARLNQDRAKTDQALSEALSKTDQIRTNEEAKRVKLETERHRLAAENRRIKTELEASRKTYEQRAAEVEALTDPELAKAATAELIRTYPDIQGITVSPTLQASRPAIAASLVAALEVNQLRLETYGQKRTISGLEESLSLSDCQQASLAAELTAERQARVACLADVEAHQSYSVSLEDRIRTAAELRKAGKRESFWRALLPRFGIGLAAGVDVHGKPNAVAGVTFGWRF